MTGHIYRITVAGKDKSYIGSAKTPTKRWSAHINLLRKNQHHSIHLQRAYNKHGESSFAFAVVEVVEDDLFLLAREQFWIWRHAGKLYNISPTAGSPLGVRHSTATRKKHSKRMKGNTIRRGASMPEDAKSKISDSLAGNKYRKGVCHTDEDKAKISASLKKAYREGRRLPPNGKLCAEHLAKWNEKIRAGEVVPPWKKVERNKQLIQAYTENGSLEATATLFGIHKSSAWEIIKKYAPELLPAGKRKVRK